MPRNYKLLTGLIALAGSLTLIITGEINPLYYPFVILMLYGYVRLLRNRPQGSRLIIGLSSIGGLFLFFFDAFIITGDYLVSVGHLSLIFHAIKSFDIKEPYDPLQVYFMALLQLVVASEFTTQMLFGVIIIVFIVLFIFVMIMAHYIKAKGLELQTTGVRKGDFRIPISFKTITLLVIITIILSTVSFISLPRLRYGLWGKSHVKGIKNAGFTERMDLSSGELKLDPTVVMRIELRPLMKGPYYWRGMTLDYYDGKIWSNSFLEIRNIIKKENEKFILGEPVQELIEQDILLEPVDSDVLFLMDQPVSINITALRIEKDSSGTIYLPKKGARRFHYIVKSNPRASKEGGPVLPYLQIPEALKAKMRNFTEEILAEKRKGEDIEKALFIENYLKKNYTYSLTVTEPPEGIDPVSYFLFNEKKGYCEHYASAMTLMLRSIGIPARIVTGFIGGELNDVGNYIIVRQKDAHSWVEALIDGRWHRFDPTPSQITPEVKPPRIFLYLDYLKLKWQRYVVSFSNEDQRRIVEGIKGFTETIRAASEKAIHYIQKWFKEIFSTAGSLFLLMVVIPVILLLLKKRFIKIEPHKEVSRYYIKFKKLLGSKGFNLQDSTTAGELLALGLRQGLPEKELREFIYIYESSRFGPYRADMKRYKELYKRLKEVLLRTHLHTEPAKIALKK